MQVLDEQALAAYESAMLIRRVEERLLELFAQGKLFGTVHTCIGQELVAVAVAEALGERDWVFSNHRCHGHFIARTDQVEGLIAEIMGKTTGVCGGWGGSQHLCYERFFSNGIQGGIVPCAAGLALSEKLAGTDAIAAVFIGEGTLGEGVVYETANLISKWSLPLLIVLENNRFSQSTPQETTIAGDMAARFEAFGIEAFAGDTWHLPELMGVAQKAAGYVRSQSRPALLIVETDRLKAHSKGDDDRDPAQVQGYWDRDLLRRFEADSPEDAGILAGRIDERIDRAVEDALAAEYPPAVGYGDEPPVVDPPSWSPTVIETRARVGEALAACFHEWMGKDERIVMLGEDILSPYGGAFKATLGLSDAYPDRVKTTTISEAAIVGFGNGLALSGMRPVCEIMFGDFLTLAADQIINHAAKFPRMYNGQVQVPVIVRTPMGGGRGYGPTHSQSLEKHFLGLPQTQVLALHPRIEPSKLYGPLFETIDRMTLVVENKLLYAKRLSSDVAPGWALEQSGEVFPTTRLRPASEPDVTVVCYGGALPVTEEAAVKAFEQHDVVCEVVCPTRLYPLNLAPVLESVARSGRLVVVEEGHGFAAWGSEVVSGVFMELGSAVRSAQRVYAPAHPIPSCGPLEKQLLPNAQGVCDAVVAAMEGRSHGGG
ncbi:MAG: thiamine pyrophosphate-dependent enzyme [Planctomycetota bacterium]